MGGAVPADVADACDAPECFIVTHGFLMSPPILVVPSGASVEWETGSSDHWFVEHGSTGGCLGFATDGDDPRERVRFIVDSDALFAVYKSPKGGYDVVQCTGAVVLPNGMAALRYECALHARGGGQGLLLVSPPSGEGPGWDYLA